jgi:hypothetical protein
MSTRRNSLTSGAQIVLVVSHHAISRRLAYPERFNFKEVFMPGTIRTASKRSRRTLIFLSLALLTSAHGLAEPVRIHNDSPKLPPRTVALEELWRVGGEDSEFIFGMIIDSTADKDGNVYLLDNQLGQVEVFSPDGAHLRTLSRQGDGPGEVRNPIALTMLPDGTLGIIELFPSKVVKLSLTGEPAGSVTFLTGEGAKTGFTISVNCRHRAGVFLLAGMRGTPSEEGQKRSHYVASYSDAGEEKVRYCETEALLTFNPPTFIENELLPAFWFGNAIGPDGRVYVATSRDSYTIEVFRPDGAPERIIERQFENRPRDARDRHRMEAMVDAWYTGVPVEVERTFSDHEPPISELFVAEDGTLWVQNSHSGRDQAAGILLTYDTFDPEGQYLQQVSIACEGDAAYDGLRFLGDGRVLLIKGYVLARWGSLSPGAHADFGEDEAGEMEVICCRMAER